MPNQIAYGFVGLQHLFSERLEDVNVATMDNAIRESVNEHNRQAQALMDEMAMATTDYKIRFKLSNSHTLQPLDEWGNPKPVRPAGHYDVSFPIQGGGTAWGDNRVTRALSTVADLNQQTLERLGADADWMKRHKLAALFDNVSWTFDDPAHGELTIMPLANGDAVLYNRKNGELATDNHYLAQADAIANSTNPFPAIHDELTEHPGNDGPVVVYVAKNLTDSIEALSGFVEVGDPDIELGANSDTLAGRLDRGFGDEVLGKVDKCWIIEWAMLPDNYMLATVRGSGEPALKMRQYPAASLQGLFPENHSPDGNLREYRFIRYAGFGANNRVRALVYQIGNGTYQIPSGFDAPLPV